jgi:hypothetical protein
MVWAHFKLRGWLELRLLLQGELKREMSTRPGFSKFVKKLGKVIRRFLKRVHLRCVSEFLCITILF